jgi:elongation factor G
MAFRICTAAAVREAMTRAQPKILEPVMKLEVEAPTEFQGAIVSGLNQRMGLIQSSDPSADGSGVNIVCDVPLAQMFGYSTALRSITQGKGEFTMDYSAHPLVRRASEARARKRAAAACQRPTPMRARERSGRKKERAAAACQRPTPMRT